MKILLLIPVLVLASQPVHGAEPPCIDPPRVIERKEVRTCAYSDARSIYGAIEKNCLNLVEGYIRRGSTLEVQRQMEPYYHETPLFFAARLGRIEIIRALLKGGADPYARIEDHSDRSWETLNPLRIAIARGDAEAVRAFVDSGMNLEDTVYTGGYLHHSDGTAEVVRILLSHGAPFPEFLLPKIVEKRECRLIRDLGAQGLLDRHKKDGELLEAAIRNDDYATIHALTDLGFSFVNSFGGRLAIASVKSREMLDYLVSIGVDLNMTNKDGQTVLHQIRDPEIMELFLSYGLDLNRTSANGDTPLAALLRVGSLEPIDADLFRRMIRQGARTDGLYGATSDFACEAVPNRRVPLTFFAALRKPFDFFDELIGMGLPSHDSNIRCRQPVHLLAHEYDLQRVNGLLDDPSVSVIPYDKGTDLMRNILAGLWLHKSQFEPGLYESTIRKIVQLGYPKSYRPIGYDAPLSDIAGEQGGAKYARVFLELGFNPNMRDEYGRCALDFALIPALPDQEMVSLLKKYGAKRCLKN